MARILPPVLMGEQSALYSVSSLIPILGNNSEVESQFYLTTWAVDEARHTELFARRELTLPLHPLLRPRQVQTVAKAVTAALDRS